MGKSLKDNRFSKLLEIYDNPKYYYLITSPLVGKPLKQSIIKKNEVLKIVLDILEAV